MRVDRRHAPRAPARDRLLGGRRGPGRPRPGVLAETLLEALGGEQPRALLLTHIHLDHAAATGALVRRWPDLEVYVHERGAPHLIDPSKLLASAERLYGDQMERLWGEIVPVPEANVTALSGGETVLGMRVAYTPGHASHHVCYLHEESGTAFVGDVAAVPHPGHRPDRPPHPAARHRHRDLARLDRDRRGLAARAARAHPLRRRSRTRPSTSPTVRERLREEAELAARASTRRTYERRHREPWSPTALATPRRRPS